MNKTIKFKDICKVIVIFFLVAVIETNCLLKKDLFDFAVNSKGNFINIQVNDGEVNDLYIYETLPNLEKKLTYYSNVEKEHDIFGKDFGQYIDKQSSNLTHVMLKNYESINKIYPLSVSVVDQESIAKQKEFSLNYDQSRHIIIIIETNRITDYIPDVVGTKQEFWGFMAFVSVIIFFLVFFKTKKYQFNCKMHCCDKADKEGKTYKSVNMNSIRNGNTERVYENIIQPKLNLGHGI